MQLELETAALDAIGQLSLTQAGAELVAMDPRKVLHDVASKSVGRAPNMDIRLSATHALANVAGSG